MPMPVLTPALPPLRFAGTTNFRMRLVLATLANRTVIVDKIRDLDERPGLRDCEVSFLRLLDKLSNGSVVEINDLGTRLRYRPGVLQGGRVSHDCGSERAIAYFLEPLLVLTPFAKEATHLTLTGITNGPDDVTIDTIRTVALVVLERFIGTGNAGLQLKIARRGAPPAGGGQVVFRCPIVRTLAPCQVLKPGLVRRIRGIAYTARVSPQMANRMIDKARSLLNAFTPDVFIYSDHNTGPSAGNSPGYSISLVAETTTGVLYSAQAVASAGDLPDDLGMLAARRLYAEIAKSGCVDTSHQWLMFCMMALGPEDVSKVRIGKLSPFSIQVLRDIRDVLGVTFKVRADAPAVAGSQQSHGNADDDNNDTDQPAGAGEDTDQGAGDAVDPEAAGASDGLDPALTTIICSCLGVGQVNLAKKTT